MPMTLLLISLRLLDKKMLKDANGTLPYSKTITLADSFTTVSGGVLAHPEICYETWGKLNPDSSNVILLFHALSGDSHCASHNTDDSPGWWEEAIGPGKMIDTDKYYIICANILGGCRGTTGPNSINPKTGEIYGPDFPELTIEDMVKFHRLFIDTIAIKKIRTVIGASMGGMCALQWGVMYSEITSSVSVFASAHRLSTQALAFDIVGRNAILHDPMFHEGKYAQNNVQPSSGLAIARMIGHITYLSKEGMRSKFEEDRLKPRDIDTEFEKLFSVGSYLGYQGDKFVERFDANSYITLTKAMDRFDLGKDIITLKKTFEGNELSWFFLTFSSDWLFPPEETEECLKAITSVGGSASYISYRTDAGHDAFLLPELIEKTRPALSAFIHSSGCKACSCSHNRAKLRLDLELVYSLIDENSSVLDIGCGSGDLLEALCAKNCSLLYGIDSDEIAVQSCIAKGIPALCMNAEKGIPWFDDAAFDYAVLSLTLQSVPDIRGMLTELLRVGKQAVVTFPNFAYKKLREHYYLEGRAPVSQGILHYNWYDSPNIRFFSILDFENLCTEMGISIAASFALDTESGTEVKSDKNLNADMAVYLLSP